MITAVQAAAQVAAKVPAYCSNHVTTPSQWAACIKAGWQQPTTTAANAGYFAGHNVAPWALLAGIIIGLLWLLSRAGSRKAATTSN